ncbi:hypothetical protein GS506_17950 [Rhodococcus hoagii]|nr:hypothetical protein [Prescottella equi]
MTRPGVPEPAGTTRRRIGVPTPWTSAARERRPAGYGSWTLAVAASGPPANESHVELPPGVLLRFHLRSGGVLVAGSSNVRFPADRSATTRARAGRFGRSALFHVNHVVRQRNSEIKQAWPRARVVHPPRGTGRFRHCDKRFRVLLGVAVERVVIDRRQTSEGRRGATVSRETVAVSPRGVPRETPCRTLPH